MARVTLIEDTRSDLAGLVGRIRGARGGQLHVFYRALLHNPALASAWFDFNNTVRFEVGLDARARELAIMRVAALTGCGYVWSVHEARYAPSAGVTPVEITALRDWRKSAVFGARDQALLAYVDAMTQEVAVADAVFEGMRGHFSDRETVEITVLVGAYNMQTRVLRALGIEAWKP